MNQKTLQYLVFFILLGVGAYYFTNINASVTETSCSSQGVWLKFDLADELSTMQAQIPDCASNPAGGFVGTIDVRVTTPNGNTYNLGGYTATKDSSQKISCGGSYQTGKNFIGGYIPNEGQGKYEMTVHVVHYDSTETYTVPHVFEYTRPAFAYCPTLSDKCEDGTPINSCSANKPYYCDQYGSMASKPSQCGCPNGLIIEGGTQCVAPPPPPPPPTPDCSAGETYKVTCSDGSQITSKICAGGLWTNTAQVCPVPECTSGGTQTFACPDGVYKTSKICTNGRWETVNYTCGSNQFIDPAYIIYGIAGLIVIGAGIVYLKKR